ncbi:MAG TPA: chemotaxis protein CheB [Steroidobacteraceae bacterium]|nr:chemotaxis protein CheB [Steroidobacteraceae bacterium]
MPKRDIIVVGASTGGIASLQELVSALPADLPAAMLIVLHLGANAPGMLPEILGRAGPLPAQVPEDKAAIEAGRIYVAPPDRHLLVERGRVRVVRGPKENRHRPAIDPLFRSAAWAYGPRVIGVVLSGELDDGTAGLWAIKTCGGIAVVQDPHGAISQGMPRNALAHTEIDHCVPLVEIAPLLVRLADEEVDGAVRAPETLKSEVDFASMKGDIRDMDALGTLSPYTCPTCRGALWELTDADLLRYRCHTGHAFSAESLVAEQSTAVEDALYSALRVVEEKATALRRIDETMPATAHQVTQHRITDLDATAKILRGLLAGDRS